MMLLALLPAGATDLIQFIIIILLHSTDYLMFTFFSCYFKHALSAKVMATSKMRGALYYTKKWAMANNPPLIYHDP